MGIHALSCASEKRLLHWLCLVVFSSHLSIWLLSLEMTLELFMFSDKMNCLAKSLKWKI